MTDKSSSKPGIWSLMAPVRGRIRFGIALSAISVLLGLCMLAALAWAAARLFESPGQIPWAPIGLAAAATLGGFVLRQQAFDQSHFAAFRLENVLRRQIAERLSRASLGYVEHTGATTLTKIMLEDVRGLHTFVADTTPLYARALVTPVFTLVALFVVDWRFACAAVAILAGTMVLVTVVFRGYETLGARYMKAREDVAQATIEFVQAMPIVRTFDKGSSTFSRYQDALNEFGEVMHIWLTKSSLSARLTLALLGTLPTLAAVLGLGVLLLQLGVAFDPWRWVAVLLLCHGLAESVMPMMMLRTLNERAMEGGKRVQALLEAPVLPAPTRPEEPADSSLRFEDVSFRFEEEGPDVLREVSFKAAPGQLIAIVGPSGSGKSTLVRLIPRFWDVNAGAVQIGGVDLRQIEADRLMRQVAFVFQENFLFSGTMADNIRLGTPEASDEDVIAAAKAAQIHDVIAALPEGYESKAGERGQFLSGGQRQRVAIARAILQDRPILVLDEATAWSDPENEVALMQALSHLMKGRTVLMVAHRLTTIRDADQILVMDQGRIVERGRHEALLAQEGLYADLVAANRMSRDWALTRAETATDQEDRA